MHICIKLLSLAVSPVKGRLAEGINDWVSFKSVCMGRHTWKGLGLVAGDAFV
jgi:hypothetical protein